MAVLLLASAALAAKGYTDPRADATGTPNEHPDLISVVVTHSASSVAFKVTFVRAPRSLHSLRVSLDLDRDRATGLPRRRLRGADIDAVFLNLGLANEHGGVVSVWIDRWGLPRRAAGGSVGRARSVGNVAWLSIPRHFAVTQRTADETKILQRYRVTVPREFDFVVDASGNNAPGGSDLQPRDLAPNTGWYAYRPR